MARKRKVEVAVISDVHLGTYGCHSSELLAYLKSIHPDTLILNGDIIDIWQFSKNYWPANHMKVVKHLMGLIAKGTKVYYITGNHDEMLRKFVGLRMSSFQIVNKLVLELDGKKAWFFHGDVFDVTMQHSKWLARLGAKGYDTLILLNRIVNYFCLKLNRDKVYLSRNIKNRVKSAVKFINNFEQTAAEIAITNGYDYVVCGHIHQPEMRDITNMEGKVTYLNSGDWIENLTALEYDNGGWSLYKFREDLEAVVMEEEDERVPTNIQLFQSMMVEFNLKSA
ncbi:UDP-2,3-diacylglucosamine diphosphatase [Pontibacter ramchanderi]|uniref:UDP-2,3-diacylglucosamine pyrophosphatase LpxH n=1 Tax=Pontibacter ramchanderi TaxID=1179743 RepID=A0A2N3U9X6_9BACT|nr:UDP-2,3-diacylglucosamine diphosphatase [Pontibacter ramchanderi]PKV63536.1 UDP-2,3-diacylglucosamine pyrophosphatase LpxH [Pontibacter ramchanderi]